MNVILTLLATLSCAVSLAAPLSVDMASPRAGLTFTDSEPVDIRAAVTGAAAPATVTFTVREAEGPWRQAGEVTIDKLRDGAGEAPLPLQLPGRGLYTLSLEARCGDQSAKLTKTVGVVFTPAAIETGSPWGIFYIPYTWAGKDLKDGAADIARNLRLLGASWVRFNFWAGSFGKVTVTPGDKPQVTADWSQAREFVRALRQEHLLIMGEVAQTVRELSSRPDATDVAGDAGPVYNRVKPANYELWEQLMAKLAADFKDDIQVWEIWNEANLPNVYWTGTVEDFAEHVRRTAHGLRQGNPNARIAAGGFVGGHDFADRCFQLGMGKDIDILTVHYTDVNPGWTAAWKALLTKYNLSLPIWNSEELSEVPVRNLADGIEHSFKFCHINIGYEGSRLLVNQDLTPRPPAILFSVGAHCIGTAKWVGRDGDVPGYEVHYFQRGDERLAAINRYGGGSKLFTAAASVTLAAEPLKLGEPIMVTDAYGRSHPLAITDGRARLPLSGPVYLNGARALQVLSAEVATAPGVTVSEAEDGQHGAGWGPTEHQGFSEGRTLDIWANDEPGPEGYWVEVKLNAPQAGRYEVLFAGNGLARLKPPRSLSPFVWQIDGGEKHVANDALPVTTDIPGAPEGLSTLGTVTLTAGEHTFRLKLTARRDEPDQHYALWFDAVALRKVAEDK